MKKHYLVIAPIPALIGSLLIMLSVNVNSKLILQQFVVAFLCIAACILALRIKNKSSSVTFSKWIIFFIAFILFLPIVFQSDEGPHRWLFIFGARIYLASILLPIILMYLESLADKGKDNSVNIFLWTVVILFILLLQPDASQATAFSISCMILILTFNQHRYIKYLYSFVISAIAFLTWLRPDTLAPIPYVEGVIDIAKNFGPVLLTAAICSLLLPIMLLIWYGISRKFFAVIVIAIYYLLIICCAGFQKSPMPFLGYGAGPILGYFIAVFLVMRNEHDNEF